MSDTVEVRMISNLLRAARMNGVVLPDFGQVVSLDEDSAERLVKAKHARFVKDEDDETPAPDATKAPVAVKAEVAAVEAPENASDKRGPGRPRKAAE